MQTATSITAIVEGMLDDIERTGPEFDGMTQYGAKLVIGALVSTMMAVRFYNHAGFVAALPVDSEPRRQWSMAGVARAARARSRGRHSLGTSLVQLPA